MCVCIYRRTSIYIYVCVCTYIHMDGEIYYGMSLCSELLQTLLLSQMSDKSFLILYLGSFFPRTSFDCRENIGKDC